MQSATEISNLNEKIINTLKQKENKNFEGVDVCLVRIKQEKDFCNLTFAGAKRPLFIFNAENSTIKRIKGVRKTIGGNINSFNKVDYEQEQFILHKNDIIYLTSDGFVDQHNPKRKRFGTEPFTKLLENIALKELSTQENILLEKLNNWQLTENQTDDIAILGVKF